jgi:hypothetical protein
VEAKKTITLVSMVMILGMMWIPTANAGDVSGTETIDEDYYWGQKIEFFSGDYVTISYTITVQNDVYIDVMLLNEANYNKYRNGQSFTYYLEGTDFNTIYTNVASMTLSTHDNYYLVVDNTDEPSGGAQPAWDGVNNYCTFSYTASTKTHTTSNSSGFDNAESSAWLGLVIIIALFGIILMVLIGALMYYKGKGQQTQSLQKSYEQSYQQTYQQPYQQSYQQPQPPQQPYYQDQPPPPPPSY